MDLQAQVESLKKLTKVGEEEETEQFEGEIPEDDFVKVVKRLENGRAVGEVMWFV